jgi:integrase
MTKDGKRINKTVRGTITEAKAELRRLTHSVDTGSHIEPATLTLAKWVDEWLVIKAGEDKARPKTIEHYRLLLRLHVLPTLGDEELQKLTKAKIADLYARLKAKGKALRMRAFIATILRSCLAETVECRKLPYNPAPKAPSLKDAPVKGRMLERNELAKLLNALRGEPLYPAILAAALLPLRRNELLALRWTDLDLKAKVLSIERSFEYLPPAVRRAGGPIMQLKGPKNARSVRKVPVTDALLTVLLKERARLQRIVAGVAERNTEVDLALVGLPAECLIFPDIKSGDLTTPIFQDSISRTFKCHAKKSGFAGLRLHDLRGTLESHLLADGVPPHAVAAMAGHSPEVMFKAYAKRVRQNDEAATLAIATLAKGVL